MYKEIKGKVVIDYNPEIIAWQREDADTKNPPLLYIFPEPGDNIKSKKRFAVKDYEKVLFYNKGELIGVLGGGVYELDKKAKIKGTEIVWIDTSFVNIPWGIPYSDGIPTRDGIFVGLHGDLRLKINEVKIFYHDVVSGKNSFRVQNLKEWILSLLNTSLRDIFKNYKAKQIILEDRDRIINLITAKISEEFMKYGLELETLNIIGIKSSEGTEKLFRVEQEKSKISDDIEVLRLKKQLEAEKLKLDADKKAYDRTQEILDSKLDFDKSILKAESQHMEGDIRAHLNKQLNEASVAGEIKIMEAYGDEAVEIAKKKQKEQQIKELKEKLDKLDDLLAEDKIPKDVYKTRVNRIEKELKELEK